MKKCITVLTILLSVTFSFSQKIKNNDYKISPIEVFLDDSSIGYSNVRENPNGEIILKLDNEIDYYVLNVIDFKKGWLKINNIVSVNYGYKISEFEGWIHSSIVGVSTRKELELMDKPNGKIALGNIEQEIGVKIIDICFNWVKIEYKGINGWVESKWLCGNPVTTCP
jgi:hypothetical protein